jgi:nucleotide-binding universal stress UspA family protein
LEHDGDITIEIVDGSPTGEIIDYLETHDFDQVVIGSVSESVARRSQVPVTIVH